MIQFISDHLDTLIQIATALVTAASLIAALTSTPADDTVVSKIYKIIDAIALNIGKAKETGA